MECLPSTKRPTSGRYWPTGVVRHDPALFEDIPTGYEDIWTESSLFALDPALHHHHPDQPLPSPPNVYTTVERVRKRPHDNSECDEIPRYKPPDPDPELDDVSADHADHLFSEVIPTLPSRDRQVYTKLSHPFTEVSLVRHATVKPAPSEVPQDGAVDGYVKFRILPGGDKGRPQAIRQRNNGLRPMGVHHRTMPGMASNHIPGLPPGFGTNFTLDAMDSKLMKFYIVAICAGRTLLQKTNGWLVDLAPMAEKDECVKHAVLALAAGYALDYHPSEILRQRANFHYRKASELLSEKILDPTLQEVGREDALVGALRILWCDDIVQWELRRDKKQEPRWYEAAQCAKAIMANSDPGYRYWDSYNVQCSSARISNANMLAYVDILSLPLTPLNARETECCHPWLLEGSDREVHRIYGGTGVCPKLLHMFGQITHLCGLMKDDPGSTIIPLGARALRRRLKNFHQWSELSEGYNSPEALLKSCVLNDQGLVNSATKVTELTAEAWVQAAQIYLQCRFFRLPRSHSAVQRPLNILLRCIERMPCSGPLFTSQSPFFPVFIMGIMSYRERDRKVVRDWFEQVLARAGARSSVPPVWRVLKTTWVWLDEELVEERNVDAKPIGHRTPWWEHLVERLVEREGRLTVV